MRQTIPGNGQSERVYACFRNYLVGGVMLLLLYLLLHGGFSPAAVGQWVLMLGDGLAMGGVLLLGLTGFVKMDRIGLLDWVGYSMWISKYLFHGSHAEEYVAFYDYKHLREHSTAPIWPGVVVAIIWFLVGFILSMVFYTGT